IGGLLGAALDALAAAKSGSDAQLHLADLVRALTSRTARCSAGGSAVALGRSFASQVLAVPVGEEIDRMYPGAPSEAADDGGGAEHSAGALPFRGLINDHTLRWNALTALVCLGWADQTDIARETQSDPSSSGRRAHESRGRAPPPGGAPRPGGPVPPAPRRRSGPAVGGHPRGGFAEQRCPLGRHLGVHRLERAASHRGLRRRILRWPARLLD